MNPTQGYPYDQLFFGRVKLNLPLNEDTTKRFKLPSWAFEGDSTDDFERIIRLRTIANAARRLEHYEQAIKERSFLAYLYLHSPASEILGNLNYRVSDLIDTTPFRERARALRGFSESFSLETRREMVSEVLLEPLVFSEIHKLYGSALDFSSWERVAQIWGSKIGFPFERAELEDNHPELTSIENKAICDLNKVMDTKSLALDKGDFHLAVVLNTQGAAADYDDSFTEYDLLLRPFFVKSLRTKTLVAIPKSFTSAFREMGYEIPRAVTVPNDPRLFETAGALWDQSFEDNFGSVRTLAETANELL